jgi:hypothetical protein
MTDTSNYFLDNQNIRPDKEHKKTTFAPGCHLQKRYKLLTNIKQIAGVISPVKAVLRGELHPH